jgi:CheY-like chemotaxis protein
MGNKTLAGHPGDKAVAAETVQNCSTVRAREKLSGLRVLVVDDEDDARDLLQEVLQCAGCRVETASNAEDGLHALLRFTPHVVVSDIGMPDEDGYSFVRRIRSLSPNSGGLTPAIALTAYTQRSDELRALAAGFDKHIGKPARPDVLLDAIANTAHIRA